MRKWRRCWVSRHDGARSPERGEAQEGLKLAANLSKQSLVSATLFTVGGNVLGRFFGFLREAVFASYLGTSALFDTFLLAFTLPELLAMVLFQALPVSVIPAAATTTDDKSRESQLFWSGMLWFGIGFAALAAVVSLLREPILVVLASDLTADRAAEGQRLLGLLAPYIFFRGMEAYFRSWCFAKRHFVAPAVSNIIINVTVMAAVVFFYDSVGILTLAYGWLLGSMILMVYNAISAFRLVQPSFGARGTEKYVSALWQGLLAVAAVESVSMIYPVIDRYLAVEHLGPGPISALRYATTLISIPSGVFVAAFNVASFPWISELTSQGKHDRIREMYVSSTRLLIFAMGLTAVGVAIFAQDIVRVAFQRGAFDVVSLDLTTGPVAWYALGLMFHAVYTFQLRFYYARRLYGRIVLILVTMLAVKAVLSWLLIDVMDHDGLALATSVARIIGFTVLTVDLARIMKVSHGSLFGGFVWKFLVSLIVTTGIWHGLDWIWPSSPDWSLVQIFLRLVLMAVVGIAVFVGLSRRLGLTEASAAWQMIRSRWAGKPVA